MKTFTINSTNGIANNELNWLELKTRDNLTKVTDEFLKDCRDNDVEMLSADGAFYSLVFQCLTDSRLRELGNRKNNQ